VKKLASFLISASLITSGLIGATPVSADESQSVSSQGSDNQASDNQASSNQGSDSQEVHNPTGAMLGWVSNDHQTKGDRAHNGAAATSTTTNQLTYHNGPVMDINTTYAIYWSPAGHAIAPSTSNLVNQYLADVATNSSGNVYASTTQYYSQYSAKITKASTTTAGLVKTNTYTATNTFSVGQVVTVSGVKATSSALSTWYNITGAVLTASATSFTLSATGTGVTTYNSAGTAIQSVKTQIQTASSFSSATNVVYDTTALPASGCKTTAITTACLTDAQLQTELKTVMTAKNWTGGNHKLYFIFTGQGIGSCSGTSCAYTYYCAYHSWIGSGPTATLYANMPYADNINGCASGTTPNSDVAGDGYINLISHEHAEAITDPTGTGWYAATGNENGDNCAWYFGQLSGVQSAATLTVSAVKPSYVISTTSYALAGYTTYVTSANTVAVGQTVQITGLSPAGYNGTFVVAARSATSITVANATTGTATGTGSVSVLDPTWYNQTINGHNYALQLEWSNAANNNTGGCVSS